MLRELSPDRKIKVKFLKKYRIKDKPYYFLFYEKHNGDTHAQLIGATPGEPLVIDKFIERQFLERDPYFMQNYKDEVRGDFS